MELDVRHWIQVPEIILQEALHGFTEMGGESCGRCSVIEAVFHEIILAFQDELFMESGARYVL